jgi:DNA-binding response OmpR family regulator
MGYKIFLFEDTTDLVQTVCEIFQLKGDELFAYDPKNGIEEQIHDVMPDVILVDLRMDPPGKEIVRSIRTRNEFNHIPVLLFTASNIKDSEVRAMGAQGIIHKPFNLSEIEKAVDKAITKRTKLQPQ